MKRLEQMLGPDEIAKLKAGDPNQAHFMLGRRIRNEAGLWSSESPLVQWFAARGIQRIDDMSAILLTCLHRKLNGKPIEVEQQVQAVKLHWERTRKAEEAGLQRGVLQTGIVASDDTGSVSMRVTQIPFRSELARALGQHAQPAATECLKKMRPTEGAAGLTAAVSIQFDADARLEKATVSEKKSWRAGDAECFARSLVGAKLDPRYAGKSYPVELVVHRKDPKAVAP